MSKLSLISKIPLLIFAVILLHVPYSYLNLQHSEFENIQEVWHYYVNPKHVEKEGPNIILKFQHQGQGEYSPIQLQIRTHSNQKQYAIIDDVNHTHIDQTIKYQKENIKHLILKSEHPIMFTSTPAPRMLVVSQTQSNFVTVAINFFQIIIPLLHNLIIIGMITNTLDLFFPLIMITQSLCMLAFLDNKKHYLADFYYSIFNSKLDLFNAIRLVLFQTNSGDASSNVNPLIQTYGFSSSLIYNLSGQLLVGILLLVVIMIIKAGIIFLKYQRLRQIGSKLRPIWNGFVFVTMPKCAVFCGFSIRSFDTSKFQNLFYPILSVCILIGYIIFFIQLIIQVRRINERIQYINESRLEIGLAQRIQYRQEFNFDCLNFSNLYYPAMNFLRLLVFFITISIIYDFTYASFGGPIISQLFYVMFNISSSGYTKNRDKVIYPLCDFLFIIVQLALIAVGLAQSVLHSEISVKAQIVYFTVFFFIFILLVISLSLDIIQSVSNSQKKQVSNQQETQRRQRRQRKATKSMGKSLSTHCGTAKTKTTRAPKVKEQISMLSDSDNSDISQSASSFEKPVFAAKGKVRKIRRGKII